MGLVILGREGDYVSVPILTSKIKMASFEINLLACLGAAYAYTAEPTESKNKLVLAAIVERLLKELEADPLSNRGPNGWADLIFTHVERLMALDESYNIQDNTPGKRFI